MPASGGHGRRAFGQPHRSVIPTRTANPTTSGRRLTKGRPFGRFLGAPSNECRRGGGHGSCGAAAAGVGPPAAGAGAPRRRGHPAGGDSARRRAARRATERGPPAHVTGDVPSVTEPASRLRSVPCPSWSAAARRPVGWARCPQGQRTAQPRPLPLDVPPARRRIRRSSCRSGTRPATSVGHVPAPANPPARPPCDPRRAPRRHVERVQGRVGVQRRSSTR